VYPPIAQQEFQSFVASEMKRWGEVIQRSNIKLDQK
jgi:hypothetical protein